METALPDASVNQAPLISVCMITYNHAPYIRQAIEGVLMQRTDFGFELIIGEDCGTDATRTICEEYAERYPEKIRLLPRERNLGIIGNFFATLEATRGKYVAFCEGDDYWVDPLKLQQQIEYLETHAETGCVYTDFSIYHQQSGRLEQSLFQTQPKKFPTHTDLESFICRPLYLAPCTWVFRRKLLDKPWLQQTVDGTFLLFAHLLSQMKVDFMPNTTAVYRMLPESASHSNSYKKLYDRASGLHATQQALAQQYGLSPNAQKNIRLHYFGNNLQLIVASGDPVALAEAQQALKGERLKIRFRFWLSLSHSPSGRWLIRRQFSRRLHRKNNS